MTETLIRAQPPLEFIPPKLNPFVLRGCQLFFPLWLKLQTNIAQITANEVEILANLYQQFQDGKIRLLLAFRHPSIEDPYCMGQLIWHILPQVARQQRISLKSPIHAHFMYDRGIPLWAGSTIGWLFSHLGGTSIQRGKTDLMGLRSARHLFSDGEFPLAAAPEGATNGHNEIVSPLEPGIAQLSFWCVDDLHKAKRSEQIIIVPVGIQYSYLTPPWEAIAQLLTQLEAETGLNTDNPQSTDENQLYQRLYRLGEHILTLMEQFYREFYDQSLSSVPQTTDTTDHNAILAKRLHQLLDTALQVAEQYFNLPQSGNLTDRCRRIEQAGWDRIYRQELKPSNPIPPFERGLADRVAEEAYLRMWHMRIVETFVAVTGYYVKEKPSVERFAETSLLLWDLMTRIKGENEAFHPSLGKQAVKMTIAQPINVSQRWEDYKTNRRQAVATLTQDLQSALESMIVPSC